ncbi:MAG: CvpA family protein [Lachnospiraceae bacterium]|nr:CvpA family protein [Lachnospiraceae bacterium]
MEYNWVIPVTATILIVCIIIGAAKGFVRMAVSFASIFIAIALVWALNPVIGTVLRSNTKIYDSVNEKCVKHIEKQLNKEIEKKNLDPTPDNVAKEGENLLSESWLNILGKYSDAAGEKIAEFKTNTVHEFAENAGAVLTDLVLKIIAFVVTFIIISIIMRILFFALDIVTRLPVINTLNKTVGALLGALIGIVLIWILMLVAVIFFNTTTGELVLSAVRENALVEFLYNTNPLIFLFAN